jgi:hypothetical protein
VGFGRDQRYHEDEGRMRYHEDEGRMRYHEDEGRMRYHEAQLEAVEVDSPVMVMQILRNIGI